MSCKYLCLRWSYLGGDVHFAFTWLVIPVIAGVTHTETVVVLFILAMVGLFCDQNYLLLNCHIMYLGGMPYFLVMMSFEVEVPVGVPLVHSGVICLCDGKLNVLYFVVTRCEMMNHFNYLCYFSLTP